MNKNDNLSNILEKLFL